MNHLIVYYIIFDCQNLLWKLSASEELLWEKGIRRTKFEISELSLIQTNQGL